MCGRYSFGNPDNIVHRAKESNLVVDQIRTGRQTPISYNVSPGRYGPIYLQEEDERVVDFYKWGLVPPFSTTERTYSAFNCRVESLEQGSSGIWNHAKQHQRCLVLVEGYYEWKHEGGNKTPYYIKRKDGKLLCMAGMWEKNDKIHDDPLYTYTIITTEAPSAIRWLHHRMPVIFDCDDDKQLIDRWIDPDVKWKEHSESLLKSLTPFDSSNLELYQVSGEVGKIANNYKELTFPIEDRKGTITSFFNKKGSSSSTSASKKRKQLSSSPPPAEADSRRTEAKKPADKAHKESLRKSQKSSEEQSSSPDKKKKITSFYQK